jgi:phosphoribosylformylglycinamidine synthase
MLDTAQISRVRDLLKREASEIELALFSSLWSEHCSYRSTKTLLELFGKDSNGKRGVRSKLGDNAGVIELNKKYSAVFKIESHNHPSYIEPYHGAATGVGGIIRDILAMAGKPIAILDLLHFGAFRDTDTPSRGREIVRGVSDYGNSIGVANVGSIDRWNKCYKHNPLVNVACIGIVDNNALKTAEKQKVAYSLEKLKLVLFGAKTGLDGIGGSDLLASQKITESENYDKTTIQIGDPFTGRKLIELIEQLMEKKLIYKIQDCGASGLASALTELAKSTESHISISLEKIHKRGKNFTARQLLLSESQERMCAVVAESKLPTFCKLADEHDVEYSVIGDVKKTGKASRFTVEQDRRVVVDLPTALLTDGVDYLKYGDSFKKQFEKAKKLDSTETPLLYKNHCLHISLEELFIRVISSKELQIKRWIHNQYDNYVGNRTLSTHDDELSIVEVDRRDGTALVISINSDEELIAKSAVYGVETLLLESIRQIVLANAKPLAVSNCLNFASPEGKTLQQIYDVINSLHKTASRVKLPIISGNVSLYNQYGDRGIIPTASLVVIGKLNRGKEVHSHDLSNSLLFLIGALNHREDLAKDRIVEKIILLQEERKVFYKNSYEDELKLQKIVKKIESVMLFGRSIRKGGIALTITRLLLRYKLGAKLNIELALYELMHLLFNESPGRALVAVDAREAERLSFLCKKSAVGCMQLGVFTDEPSLKINNECEVMLKTIEQLHIAHSY